MQHSHCESEPVNLDDLDLVERSLGGDEDAFASLVRRHEPRIHRVAFAILGISEDAEDAKQNVLIKLHRHLESFKRNAQFASWLTSIAMNESLSRRRSRRTMVSLDAFQEAPFAYDQPGAGVWCESPERAYSRKELRCLIEHTSRALPRRFREVFVLRDIEEKSADETAAILNVSVQAVKSRLFRARQLMRQHLAYRLGRNLVPTGRALAGARVATVRDCFLALQTE